MQTLHVGVQRGLVVAGTPGVMLGRSSRVLRGPRGGTPVMQGGRGGEAVGQAVCYAEAARPLQLRQYDYNLSGDIKHIHISQLREIKGIMCDTECV